MGTALYGFQRTHVPRLTELGAAALALGCPMLESQNEPGSRSRREGPGEVQVAPALGLLGFPKGGSNR